MTDATVTPLDTGGIVRLICPACRVTAGGLGAVLLECAACAGIGVVGLIAGPDGGLDPDELERTIGRLRAYALVMRLDGVEPELIDKPELLPDELKVAAVELAAGAHVARVEPAGQLPDPYAGTLVYDPAVTGAPADERPNLYVADRSGIVRP